MDAPQDFTSQIDQGRAGARDVAKILASFYQSLIEEGVPEGPAGVMSAALPGIYI